MKNKMWCVESMMSETQIKKINYFAHEKFNSVNNKGHSNIKVFKLNLYYVKISK